jgi:hypothetical protein
MECFFKGFDYGLLNKSTGEFKVLARNSETAFLTKFLRAYGGLGEHDNYKIGRVLRNITFSGKGFVDKPANPDSIIFTKDSFMKNSISNLTENFANLSNIGVSNIQSTPNVENMIMSSNENTTDVVPETAETAPVVANETVAPAPETVVEPEAIVDTTESSEVVSLQNRIAELESQVAQQLEIIEAAKKVAEDHEEDEEDDEEEKMKEEAAKKMKEEMAKKDEEMKKVKSELNAALEAIAGYKMKEEEMAKKEKKMKRKASLIENGVDADSAETVVEKFESMADDAFEAMTSLIAGKMPPWLEKVKKDDEEDKKAKEKKKASEASTDPEVLDTVEVVEEVNLGVGGETESSVDTTRAALIDFVSSRLGKK